MSALALAASACQTAQKPAMLLPPSSAPALVASPKPQAAQTRQAPAPAVPTTQSEQKAQTPQPVSSQREQVEQEAAPVAPAAADPVADLIAKVEKEYQAGLDAYSSGNIDEAKQHFDSAFNALLDSNLDVRSDDRLEKEFDHIVEGVNHLDIGGLGADSEEAQQSEPAPIDETNGITPSADPNVRAKAQAEIRSTHSDLPLMMTDQVAGYISYFSNRGRGTFERAFARSGRYHDMMVRVLKEEGVPQDLIYLAQAESGFHPLAVSRAGARGIWQFMGSRARGYGLERSMWVDDRQDPVKSTRAAARHLKDLYSEFGDWYLAMAAYNSGPGTVQAAVKRTGYADFWELYRRNVLPKETRNYVPIILAMTIVSKNLSQYGFTDVSMDDPLPYDSISIDYPVDLRLVAQCVDTDLARIQELNPSLLRLSTPREGKFELHLPMGTKAQYQTAVATIPADMRLWWRYHKVQPGDTVASLSRSYHVTAKSILEVNQLEDPTIEAGSAIVIPVAVGKHTADDSSYARRITRYKVRRGDTVETVAENFGVSAQMLRRWNGLRGNGLNGRKVLALHLPVTPGSEVASKSVASKSGSHAHKTTQVASAKSPSHSRSDERAAEENPVRHTVKSGETLYSIATTYRTTVAALRRTNGDIAVLRPGMILVVEPSR